MAVNLNLAEALQARQTMIDENVGVNNPTSYGKMTGMLNWMFSSNPTTIEQIMQTTSSGSKYRPVQIRYLPKKGTENVGTSDASLTCDAVATRRELVDTYNPSLFAFDKFTIDEKIILEGTQEQLNQRLAREIEDASRNVREQIDNGLFAAANTSVGANPAQGVGKGGFATIELLNSDGTVSAENFDVIKNDQEDNYMVGDAGIVGKGKARKYMNRLAVGGVNDGGVDVNAVMEEFGMAIFKDSDTLSVLGNEDDILVFYPGLAQYYSFQYYNGSDFALVTPDSSQKTVITDSVYPQLRYDFKMKYDDGCSTGSGQLGAWTGTLSTYYDLWTAPEEAFGEGYANNLNDFTGIVKYRVTQA